MKNAIQPSAAPIPPHDLDIEAVTLGAMLIDGFCLIEVIGLIHSKELFYKFEHQDIFEAIARLFNSGRNVDLLTVSNELRQLGKKVELSYVNEITFRVNSSANVVQHIYILKELWVRRVLIPQGQFLTNCSYDLSKDIFDSLGKIQNVLIRTNDFLSIKKGSSIQEITKEILSTDFNQNTTYVPTGFSGCDKVLGGGFGNGELIIVAARPGMGKTTLVLKILRNATVMFTKKVALFSLEMSKVKLGLKLLSMETGISVNRLKRKIFYDGELDKVQLATNIIANMSFYIDDDPMLTISTLRAKAINLKAKQGLDLLAVDYLQLMEGEGGNQNRENAISAISRGLKLLSKELEIPIIALSQLSRAVETRTNKRPILADLRESGAIEQDADVVIFIYRDEYYDIHQDEFGNSTAGKAEIIFGKNREGSLGREFVTCDLEVNNFTDIGSKEIESSKILDEKIEHVF
jgi:replicative DNA helicase